MSGATPVRATPPRPRYQQVKEHVLHRIRAGEWPVGARIPSENRLVETLGLSRMTINRALRELADEGVVERLQGVGTFVRQPPSHGSLLELRNIADEIRARGHSHRARVISLGTIDLHTHDRGEDLARAFESTTLDAVFHVTLVHLENDIPVQIEDRWVNPEIAPAFLAQDFTRQTPTEYLLTTTPVSELEHVVRAEQPSREQQNLLAIPAQEPCLAVRRRSWSWGRVATVVTLTYPASRYALRGRYKTSPTGRVAPGSPSRAPRREPEGPHTS